MTSRDLVLMAGHDGSASPNLAGNKKSERHDDQTSDAAHRGSEANSVEFTEAIKTNTGLFAPLLRTREVRKDLMEHRKGLLRGIAET